jgi:hypothetical protein
MSLVQIASNGLFVVHDQLRDMGRMISKNEYKGSRWNVEAKELTPHFLKVQILDHNHVLNHMWLRDNFLIHANSLINFVGFLMELNNM